jgi:propanol-preferring alcohol dehydrogenase
MSTHFSRVARLWRGLAGRDSGPKQGSLTGSPIDEEDTLAFSVLQNIRPMIETVKLEQAAEAYGRMMRGDARFRMVLVMGK